MILAPGHAVAEALFASGAITLALMGLEDTYSLVGPPYLSLRSMLSLEA